MQVDTLGLSCPQPVILLKEQMDRGEKEIELLVDCGAASENTKRIAKTYGYKIINEEQKDGIIIIKLVKNDIS